MTVMESEQHFVLNWRVMWEEEDEEDVDTTAVFARETQELYPGLAGCSFENDFAMYDRDTGDNDLYGSTALRMGGAILLGGDMHPAMPNVQSLILRLVSP